MKIICLLVWNILTVFGIPHSEIPTGPLTHYENQQVDVEVAANGVKKWGVPASIIKSARYPDCKMVPSKNDGYEQKIDEWVNNQDPNKDEIPEGQRYATYFVKKRLAVRLSSWPKAGANARPSPKKFQFIATRKPIERGSKHTATGPNEFETKLGEIYCENSRVEGLNVNKVYKDCGIEQYLVGVCFFDKQVNPTNPGSNKLDLDKVFSHYGQGEVNDVNNVRRNVEAHCKNVVEFYLSGTGRYGGTVRTNAEKLKIVMKGARLAGYGTLIWYDHPRDEVLGPNCFTGWKWGSSMDWITKSDADFVQFYLDTKRYGLWYFCNAGVGAEAMLAIVNALGHGWQ